MHKRHTSRLAALLGAGSYLAASLDAPFVVLDWLTPLSMSIHGGDFACAGHACACSTERDCRLRCCCFERVSGHLPSRDAVAGANEGEPTTPVRAVVDSRCRGGDPGTGLAEGSKAPPHLLPRPAPVASMSARVLVFRGALPVPPSACLSPPGKVPISFPSPAGAFVPGA